MTENQTTINIKKSLLTQFTACLCKWDNRLDTQFINEMKLLEGMIRNLPEFKE